MEGSAANKSKTAASGDSAVLHSIADVLKPLSIAAYDNFRTILARIPDQVGGVPGVSQQLRAQGEHPENVASEISPV